MVSFEEIEGSPRLAIQASIEHADRIVEVGSLGKGQLDLLLVRIPDRDDAVELPDRTAHPLPSLLDVGKSAVDELSDVRERCTTPVVETSDEVFDLGDGRHFSCHRAPLRPERSYGITIERERGDRIERDSRYCCGRAALHNHGTPRHNQRRGRVREPAANSAPTEPLRSRVSDGSEGAPVDDTQHPRVGERWAAAGSALTSALVTAAASVDPFTLTAAHAARAAEAACAVTLISAGASDPLTSALCDGSVAIRRVRDEVLSSAGADLPTAALHLPPDVLTVTELPPGPALMASLSTRERRFGILTIVRNPGERAFGADEEVMLQGFASQAALMIEHLHALRTLEARALQSDRNRIAGNLHDLVIQQLFGVGLRLQSLTARSKPDSVVAELDDCVDQIDETIRAIRRSIFALHQPIDDRTGLRTRILNVVSATPFSFEPSVSFSGPVDSAIADEVHDELLVSLGEILTNVLRHARATSLDVVVTADLTRQQAIMRVTDDGVGWGGAPLDGHGTGNVLARAVELGGSCRVTMVDGGGTEVRWWVPLHGADQPPAPDG